MADTPAHSVHQPPAPPDSSSLDPMHAMGTGLSRNLVTRRLLAALSTVPLLTAISGFVGLLGGMVASVFSLRSSAATFWQRTMAVLRLPDLLQGITKSLIFGFLLSTVGCFQGMNIRGGTQGVGRATTQAVVIASVMSIVADTFPTKLALDRADKFF